LFSCYPVTDAFAKYKIGLLISALDLAQWLSSGDELSIDVRAFAKKVEEELSACLVEGNVTAECRGVIQEFLLYILDEVVVHPDTGALVYNADLDSVSVETRSVLFTYLRNGINAFADVGAKAAVLKPATPTAAGPGVPATATEMATGGKEPRQLQFNELSLAINLFFWTLIVGLLRKTIQNGPVDTKTFFRQLWAFFSPMRPNIPPAPQYLVNQRKNTNCVLCLGLVDPDPAAAWGLDWTYFGGWKVDDLPKKASEVNLNGILGHCSKHGLTDSSKGREDRESISVKVGEAVKAMHAAEKNDLKPEAEGGKRYEPPAKTVSKTCSQTEYFAALKRAVNHLVEGCSGKGFLDGLVKDLVDGSVEEKKLLQQVFWACFTMARSSMSHRFVDVGGLKVLQSTEQTKKGETSYVNPLRALRKQMQPFHISPLLAAEFEHKAVDEIAVATGQSSEHVSLVLGFPTKDYRSSMDSILAEMVEPFYVTLTVDEAGAVEGEQELVGEQELAAVVGEQEQAAVEGEQELVGEQEPAAQPEPAAVVGEQELAEDKGKLNRQKRGRNGNGGGPESPYNFRNRNNSAVIETTTPTTNVGEPNQKKAKKKVPKKK
jgi:hypothetical protein